MEKSKRPKRGMEMTLSTIIVIILLLITVLALILFFRDKFTSMVGAYDSMFGKAEGLIDKSMPENL